MDRKIIEYGYVSDYDMERFFININKKIKEGYQPYGSPIYLMGCKLPEDNKVTVNRVFQAVVKYED